MNYFVDSPWKHSEKEGALLIETPADKLALILSPLFDILSAPEQRDTRAQFHPKGNLTQSADLLEIEALPHLVARMRSTWLLEILRKRRLHTVFQPVVYCPAKPFSSIAAGAGGAADVDVLGYECLMRGMDSNGELVGAGPMIDLARRADLVFQLDLAARRSALLGAAAYPFEGKIFINFAPNSIYNPYKFR